MEFFSIVMLLFAVIFVVVQALIVHYLMRLEAIGCKCAMDWRRSYIMFFLIVSILYTLSAFFINRESLPILQTIMVVLGLLNVVFTLQYVHRLKKEKCECSESIYREILNVVAIFNAIIYSMLLTIVIMFLFTMITLVNKTKGGVEAGKKLASIKPLKPVKRR